MKNSNFENYINQAIDFGYENVGLTPATGDIFMDRDIFKKLDYLENLKKLKGYHFTTNFIPIKEGNIKKLLQYKKLNHIGLSIYGSDEKTFIQFTQSTKNSYDKLIKNLHELKMKLFQIEKLKLLYGKEVKKLSIRKI